MNTITKLYSEHPKTILVASAAALRLLLVVAFPALPDLLTLRAEISTPVNGFKRCMWGMDGNALAPLARKEPRAEIVIQCKRVCSFTSVAWIRMMAASSTRSAYTSHVESVTIKN